MQRFVTVSRFADALQTRQPLRVLHASLCIHVCNMVTLLHSCVAPCCTLPACSVRWLVSRGSWERATQVWIQTCSHAWPNEAMACEGRKPELLLQTVRLAANASRVSEKCASLLGVATGRKKKNQWVNCFMWRQTHARAASFLNLKVRLAAKTHFRLGSSSDLGLQILL